MTKVFVIDDHPVFVDGIKAIFKDSVEDIVISDWAYSVKEALPKLRNSDAEIVLLDLVMPDFSGVEFCLVIKNQFPEKKVVALTGSLNTTILYNTWVNRADAILMKYCGKSELVSTIKGVLSGRRIIGNQVPEFYDEITNSRSKKPTLTKSEQQILNLLAQGHSRQEVGDMLCSSKNAINFHCKNLFKKFKKTKLIAVIEEARKENLIP